MRSAIESSVRRLRRTLHRSPELAHQEWQTAAVIESALLDLGLEPFRPAATSVAVVVGPPEATPSIGFRADLDALAIAEESPVPYASAVDGVMHACGHDGHAAALVGLAQALLEAELEQSALLVFQQAEESFPSGAPLVLAGLPDHVKPAEFFGFHVWPQLPAGTVGLRVGSMLGAVAGLSVSVTGRSGKAHGTYADEGGADALAAGVDIYHRLSQAFQLGRTLGVGRSTSLSIGLLAAGEAPNTPATSCQLKGTLRSTSWQAEEIARRRVEAIVEEVAERTTCAIEFVVESGIRPPVINDSESVSRVRQCCVRRGIDCLDYPPSPVGVSDDFGWFIDDAPGALVFVGSRSDQHFSDLHTPTFDFDESILMTIVALGVELTRQPRPT